MMKIKEAIIVEGIYDKMKLEQFVDAAIIPTNGFALFSDKSLLEMIRRLASKKGINPYGFRPGRLPNTQIPAILYSQRANKACLYPGDNRQGKKKGSSWKGRIAGGGRNF